ncbi:MAG: hypothetical protein K9L86_03335 [Candidatus Omnitrophica bacterium]|nr:hypothetical protein [Candidatus Omnitrophota bacterium]
MKAYKILLTACIFLFIFLCFFHYFSQRPLWGDEKFVLDNIRDRSFKQLFGVLKDSQAFPRVYLGIVQSFSKVFQYHVLSLRFLPFLCMLSAFFIWKRVYRQVLDSRWLALLTLSSLSSIYYFSYYAAELKPYSMDVLVVAIFCLYFVYQKKLDSKGLSKKFIVATLLLPITLFFSYASFLVFWIVIYNFLFVVKRSQKILYLLMIYSALCFLFGISTYWIDLRHGYSTPGLISYWNDYFVCTDSAYCFFKSFGEGLRKLATWWFGNVDFLKRSASFVIPFFTISLFVYGFKSFKSNSCRLFSLDSVGLAIFLELLVLGILKKYPFTGERVTLFFAPFVFYFIIKGISSLKKIKILYRFFVVSYLGLILGCGLNSILTYLKLYN